MRRVRVIPPDPARETARVLEHMILIAIVALLTAGATGRRAAGAAALLAHQIAFADQPPARQRTYRELRAAAGDILRARSVTGGWPPVEELARELVEPFAAGDPRWSLAIEGVHANYAGGAWLIAIEEPPAALRGVRHPGDEESHRVLDDGTIVHVTFWFREEGPPTGAPRVLAQPQREGFREIVTGQAPGRKDR